MSDTIPVRVTGKPSFSGRGKNRVQVAFLPAGRRPAGDGWTLHGVRALYNIWHKPAVLPRVRRAKAEV